MQLFTGIPRKTKSSIMQRARTQEACTFGGDAVRKFHLQDQAVVGRSLVFAAVVLAVINVHMVQLQEAHQISGCLQRGSQRRGFRTGCDVCEVLKMHMLPERVLILNSALYL